MYLVQNIQMKGTKSFGGLGEDNCSNKLDSNLTTQHILFACAIDGLFLFIVPAIGIVKNVYLYIYIASLAVVRVF